MKKLSCEELLRRTERERDKAYALIHETVMDAQFSKDKRKKTLTHMRELTDSYITLKNQEREQSRSLNKYFERLKKAQGALERLANISFLNDNHMPMQELEARVKLAQGALREINKTFKTPRIKK